jgi:uncharacterized Zn finger protein
MMRLDPGRRWWSRRWLEVLEDSGAALARDVQRGQGLARRGAVERLELAPGRVAARVLDDQPRPHEVELRWPVPSDAVWDGAVTALSGELRFTAALLDGELPEEAEQVLGEAGLTLVPELDDVTLVCGCATSDRLCRHAAATWTAAASVLDRDVFALLRLRGRGRDELLAAVRSERGVGPEPSEGAGLDLARGLFAARDDLDAIELHPAPVADPAALFRQLGEPPGVDDERPFELLIERAAATAWRLAAGDGSEAADEELLLAELRAQRVGTAGSLAEALGREAAEVREELDRLFSAGTVMRTGSGQDARYRAAAS